MLLDWGDEFSACYFGPSQGNIDRYDRYVAYVGFKEGVDKVTVLVGDLKTKKEVSRRSWSNVGVLGVRSVSQHIHDNVFGWASGK